MKTEKGKDSQHNSDKLIKDCLKKCLVAAENDNKIKFVKLESDDIEKERLTHCQYVL